MRTILMLMALVAAALVSTGAAPPARAPKPAERATTPALGTVIRPAIDAAIRQLQADGDVEAAHDSLAVLFDQVVAFGDATDRQLFVDAAFAWRMTGLLAQADATTRRDTMTYLLANGDLAQALAFIVKPERDKPADVFAMLDRLRARHGDSLNTYANLTAAICVVHDQQYSQRINENRPTAPDPVLLYEFFVANEKKLLYGVRNVPAELLVHVVNCCASIDEMQWALKRYASDDNIGARFFDIKYDTAYLQSGKDKKVDAAGWNLPNILKYGGICADQAYFTTTIGKCIGVPTAYTTGASSEAGHAWVGFVQADKRRAWWNFNSGRYEEYQGVRGSVIDPQTLRPVPDSTISLLADFVGSTTLDRHAAAAYADAALRLIAMEKDGQTFDAAPPEGFESIKPRSATTDEALNLLETGLKSCPGYAEGWFAVRQLAEDGRLTLDEKKKWGGVLHRLCGERYPDFYLAIVQPMIETIDDVDEQNALWNAAFKVFQSRFDLAASVRMAQADMWLEHNEPEKAGQCCEDVINRYANAGPFVIEALRKAEKILQKSNDRERILALYRQAWSKIQKPRDMAGVFVAQSNWFRVGEMYAKRLDDAGLGSDAANVRTALGMR